MINEEDIKIGIIGLGYVGLPLAVEFGNQFPTLGFDINLSRVKELKDGIDRSLEVPEDELKAVTDLSFTDNADDIRKCNVYIITVPTPIDQYKRPDLTPLIKSSSTIGKILSKGDFVIYESTVFPGCTEEICAPILSKLSGLILNDDFYVGYSPERINPGDKENRLPCITKITSGSNQTSADFIDQLYQRIITAGTHKTSSIKIAEAAKIIENTQRDVNIALINELALIFNRLEINTTEVLEAAGTKWNFLPFRPGLVGGHCIGVDPYYLTHKAQEIGYHPDIILAGRRINDGMGSYLAQSVISLMAKEKITIHNSKVLILGLTFKENCPDIRNTRVTDIYHELKNYHCQIDVHDPWVDRDETQEEYGIAVTDKLIDNHYDAIILAVAHREFVEMGASGIKKYLKKPGILYDVKSIFSSGEVTAQL